MKDFTGIFGVILRPSWEHFGGIFGHLGAILVALGSILVVSWGHLGAVWGRSWLLLAVLCPEANAHVTVRFTGVIREALFLKDFTGIFGVILRPS